MLRTFCGTKDTPPKSNLTKEKKFCRQTSEKKRLLAVDLAIVISKTRGWNPCPEPGYRTSHATVRDLAVKRLGQPLQFLNHDHAWRGLRLLPIQPYTQKTLAIDR
jgi:hypothetical protein